jgi:ribonuclease HI
MYSKIDEKEWLLNKRSFMNTFKMKDLNDAEWILGIRITRDRTTRTIKLDHEVQINKSLEAFHMNECNPASTPTEAKKLSYEDCPNTKEEKDEADKLPYKSIVGSLQYIALSTRPDIAYAVNQLSRYIANPGQSHWQAGKRVLRYLKGTAKSSLLYKDYDGNQNTRIEIFCDADWAGDTEDRKSTTGVIIKLNGCPIIWLSKKQSTVALSTAEAEYIAIATALQELLWINQYLTELNLKDNETAVLKSDNQAAIRIATNDTLHSRSKHIDIRYHFIREVVKRGEVELNWIGTKDQQADINTKGLDGNTFKGLRDRIMSK